MLKGLDLKTLAFRRPLPVRGQAVASGTDGEPSIARPGTWSKRKSGSSSVEKQSGFQPTIEPTGFQPVVAQLSGRHHIGRRGVEEIVETVFEVPTSPWARSPRWKGRRVLPWPVPIKRLRRWSVRPR